MSKIYCTWNQPVSLFLFIRCYRGEGEGGGGWWRGQWWWGRWGWRWHSGERRERGADSQRQQLRHVHRGERHGFSWVLCSMVRFEVSHLKMFVLFMLHFIQCNYFWFLSKWLDVEKFKNTWCIAEEQKKLKPFPMQILLLLFTSSIFLCSPFFRSGAAIVNTLPQSMNKSLRPSRRATLRYTWPKWMRR